MKKILYTIGVTSAVLFTACSEDKGTSTEVVNNDTEEVNPNNINDYDQPGTAGSRASTAYTDADLQQNAKFVSDEMTRDLQLDDATAVEIVKIYYKRNQQLGQLELASTRTDSTTNQSSTNRSSIEGMTDQEIKAVLTPEQYKKYQQNRDRYNRQREKNAETNGTGSTGTDSGTGSGTDRPTGSNQ